jgi:DNA polymerase V
MSVAALYSVPTMRRLVRIPLVSTRISAGFPSPADEFMDKSLDLHDYLVHHPASTFFIRVEGDSMLKAGIHHGDLLVVDRSLNAQDGKVVIAVVNGEFLVKRLRTEGKKIWLQAENDRYPPIVIDEFTAFQIWGVVTAVIHPMQA